MMCPRGSPWSLLVVALLCADALVAQAPAGLTPYVPGVMMDKKGHEWFIEQNGGLQRSGTVPSMIGNSMALMMGNQQFYSQQPMISSDGKELVLQAGQVSNGLNVTRRITIMENEGALRYVEEFSNITNRDLTVSVELRHNFGGQTKSVLTDSGRVFKDGLGKEEFGLVAVARPDEKAPSVLFTVRAPGASVEPRITLRNNYQLSAFYSLTIPAGGVATLVHGITQADVGVEAKPQDLARALRPIAPRSLTKGMAKHLLKAAVNIARQGGGHDFGYWFDQTHFGAEPDVSDILLLSGGSRLKGRYEIPAGRVKFSGRLGEVEVTSADIAAIAFPEEHSALSGWVHLRDGQRWRGALTTPGGKFILTSGAELQPPPGSRLVLRKQALEIKRSAALLENQGGERIAALPSQPLRVTSAWGNWEVDWDQIVCLSPAEPEAFGAMLHLEDGSRLRVLPVPVRAALQTVHFGQIEFNWGQVSGAVTPKAVKDFEGRDPASSFIELPEGQRVAGRVTNSPLRFYTLSGPVELASTTIRDMRVLESPEAEDTSRAPLQYVADLWGGGSLNGTLADGELKVEGRGYSWTVPAGDVLRLANPAPVQDAPVMRRIGELVGELGNSDWTRRERATAELREMGLLAKTSLQEALRRASDAEVRQRLELLLTELEE